MTVLLGVYGVVRFVWLAPNVQGMANASGYFFERLEVLADPRTPSARGSPRFTIYNCARVGVDGAAGPSRAAACRHFFAAGRWVMFRRACGINVISSAITTTADFRRTLLRAGVGTVCVSGRPCSRERRRLVRVREGTKLDERRRGLHAIAAFWAVQSLLTRPLRAPAALLLTVLLLVASTGWSIRTIGVNHVLRAQAFAVHNDWAVIPRSDAAARHVARRFGHTRSVLGLRDQSLAKSIVNPWFVPRWADRVFDGDYF
mgnify:CR=1 FL=1